MVCTHHHSHPISLIIIHLRNMRWHPLHHRLRHPSRTRHRGPIPRQRVHPRLCLPRILGFSPSSCCTRAPPHARATAPSWAPLSHSSPLFLKRRHLETRLRHARWVGVKLKAKPRNAYVTDTGNLPPDPGVISLVFLTKGLMEWFAREAV